jgi:tetratricopeptide (TPR) repeat protein
MARTAVPRVRKSVLRVRAAIAALIVAACIAWLAVRRAGAASPSLSACEAVFRNGEYRRAIGVCFVSSESTRDPRELARAASAAMQIQDFAFAQLLASRLQATWLFGDAHQILGYVALRSGDAAGAWRHARLAFLVHELAGNERALAGDAALLSEVALKQGDFTTAITAADEAVRLAARLHQRGLEASVKRIRAFALRRVGEWDRAIADLRDAVEAAPDACSSAWNQFELALAYEDRLERLGDAGRAITEATKLSQECGDETLADALSFHVAWVHRIDRPEEARARLDALLPSHEDDAEIWLLDGYLHAGAGALAEARRDLARADACKPSDADWPWLIAQSRAELAELHGGVFGPMIAEFHYRRAVAMVAALRAAASGSSAYLVASHRGPYDGLIALLARQRRWRDVLGLMLELDASDMLRATANAIARR